MSVATAPGLESIRAPFAQDPERNAEAVRRITDLFLRDSRSFTDEHVAVFDEVIGMLAARIEAHARAELAERLSDLDNAPPNLIRRLARDEILVARSVLSRSPRLCDEDLVAIALEHGRNHMIAIAERPMLSERVTDILVEHGDQVVVHAAVRNPQAHFSAAGFGRLVSRSRQDEALQAVLGERPDLPLARLKELVDLAKTGVRRKLIALLGDRLDVEEAVEAGATAGFAEAAGALWQRVGPPVDAGDAAVRAAAGTLGETDVMRYALAGAVEEAESALGILAGLPATFASRLLDDQRDDLLLIVCRSLGFAWETVEALRHLKRNGATMAIPAPKLRSGYEALARPTAQRVVRLVRAREPEAAPASTAAGADQRRLATM